MKIKYFLSIGLFLLGLLSPSFVQAESSIKMCMDDYYVFILGVRSENTRTQTFHDLFSLGYCQLNDILELDAELEDLKDNFRSAAFSCANTSDYKTKYHEILMEMYFVRNIQKSTALNIKTAKDLQTLKADKLAKLKTDMENVFVVKEKRVGEDVLAGYFANWSKKYDDRIIKYSGCDEGPWAELTQPITDFVKTLESFKWEIDTGTESSFWESVKETATPSTTIKADEDMTAIGQSMIRAWDYLTTEKEIAATEVKDPETPASLSGSGESYTLQSALNILNDSELYYNLESAGTDRMQRYKMLYGYGGAVASTNMQSIVEAFNRLVEESNNKDFPNIQALLSGIYDKQCN
ncbi:MAG: hypothetical protein WC897_01265 [Candidatus Gracilibacteria bacterium]